MEDTIRLINTLARSYHRVQILEALGQQERLSRDEIKEHCDSSRTTISRNLIALEDNGWITNTNRDYSITSAGELVLEKLTELAMTIEVTQQHDEMLEWLPLSEFNIDPILLTDATFVSPEPSNPYAPFNYHIGAMNSTERFRCILPAIALQPITIVRKRVVDRGCIHEVIVDHNVAETFRSEPAYADILDEMIDTGRFIISVYEGKCSYYFGIFEEVVQLGVKDEEGVPRGLVEFNADSAEVSEWADQIFNRYKQRSEPFSRESMATV